MPEIVEAWIAKLGEDLVAVVLFGSHACGEPTDRSDWDFLLIARNLPERSFERRLLLKSALPARCRCAVSLVARTPEEFESHVSSLHLDIALDGRVEYDPRGYAADRLARVRDWVATAGLVRDRTAAGDVWRCLNGWTGWPAGNWAA